MEKVVIIYFVMAMVLLWGDWTQVAMARAWLYGSVLIFAVFIMGIGLIKRRHK